MMKITATAATPYRAVLLLPDVDVETTVVTDPLSVTVAVVVCPLAPVVTVTVVAGPDAVVVDVVVVVETDVVVLVDVTAVGGGGGGTFCRVRATMSPGVVPGHVDTASKLQVPTGVSRYSCPFTAAPIVTPWSMGAPM